MDKIRDTALPGHSNQTAPSSQGVDEAEGRLAEEVTSASSIEERFANWGSD